MFRNNNLVRKIRSRIAGENGQALIELCLTVPLFIVILGGAVELGRVAYVAITVTNAAKAAVAYGATNTSTAVDGPGIIRAAQADALNLPASAGFNVTTYTPSCVCKSSSASVAMTSCSDTCGAYVIETIKVKTNAPLPPLFNFPMFQGKTFNLTSVVTQEVLY